MLKTSCLRGDLNLSQQPGSTHLSWISNPSPKLTLPSKPVMSHIKKTLQQNVIFLCFFFIIYPDTVKTGDSGINVCIRAKQINTKYEQIFQFAYPTSCSSKISMMNPIFDCIFHFSKDQRPYKFNKKKFFYSQSHESHSPFLSNFGVLSF